MTNSLRKGVNQRCKHRCFTLSLPHETGRIELKYLIIIEKTETGFSAYSPDLPGCVATGGTREECEKAMEEAIELHVEGMPENDNNHEQAPRSHMLDFNDLLGINKCIRKIFLLWAVEPLLFTRFKRLIYCLFAIIALAILYKAIYLIPAYSGSIAEFASVIAFIVIISVYTVLTYQYGYLWISVKYRLKNGLCIKCAYNLRGLPSGAKCPECGSSNPSISIQDRINL